MIACDSRIRAIYKIKCTFDFIRQKHYRIFNLPRYLYNLKFLKIDRFLHHLSFSKIKNLSSSFFNLLPVSIESRMSANIFTNRKN